MIAPWYVMAYTKLDRIAWRYGYALALHGSMTRDLDLIAIPWTEDADSPEKLLKAIQRFTIQGASKEIKLSKKLFPTKKPHGRTAYSFPIGHEHYLDVSVMPRKVNRK